MEINYQNTYMDIIKFYVFHQSRSRVQQVSLAIWVVLLGIVFWALGGVLDYSFSARVGFVLLWELLLLLLWAAIVLVTVFFSYSADKNKGVLTAHRIKLLETHVVEETNVNTSSHTWPGLTEITQNREYIFIYTTQHGAYLIPKRAFESVAAANEFYEYASQKWSTAKASAPASHAP